MTTAPESFFVSASAVAKDIAAIASFPQYAAHVLKQEKEDSLEDLVLTSLSVPLAGSDSYSDETCKICKNRRSKKKSSHRESSMFSSEKGTWLLHGAMKEVAEASKSSTTSSNIEDRASKLKFYFCNRQSLLK